MPCRWNIFCMFQWAIFGTVYVWVFGKILLREKLLKLEIKVNKVTKNENHNANK